MSYQYPSPPSSGPDFKLSPRTMGNFQISPAVPPELSQQALDGKLFSQEPNQHMPDQTVKIKLPSSTPNIRDQAVIDAALAASAEKGRNKLGYHRTSVACGHCRRRKIRCILAPGDLQTRCTSCIRLKKECNFYPVVQPPQLESKGQRGTNGGRGLGRASSSAPPTNQLGRTSETQNELSYPNMAMPSYLGYSNLKRPKDDSFAPENRGLGSGAQNEYPPHSAAWLQPKIQPSTRPVADASGYWRVNTQEPPLAPGFPMFSQSLNPPQQQNWSPSAVERGSREDLNWPGAQRSASFGIIENLPHQASYMHFPPTSSETNNQGAFVIRISPPGAKPYMHDLLSDDPNSVAVSGLTIESSHVSDPRQSVQQYGYMNTSPTPSSEVFNDWFQHTF